MKLAQGFTIPNPSGQPEVVSLPSSIPTALQGGAGTSGAKLLQLGITYFTIAGVLIALIVVIFSGIQMITSQGDTYKLASAKKRLFFGILGLIIVLGAFFIIRIVFTILNIPAAYLFNPGSLLNQN